MKSAAKITFTLRTPLNLRSTGEWLDESRMLLQVQPPEAHWKVVRARVVFEHGWRTFEGDRGFDAAAAASLAIDPLPDLETRDVHMLALPVEEFPITN